MEVKKGLPARNGAKAGYKQTEVGVIPEDWVVWELGKVVEKFANGGTPSTKNELFWTGDIPWITGADILNQKVGEIRRHITKEAVESSSTNIVSKGNLLIVSRTGVGKLAIAPFDVAISQDFTGIYVRDDSIIAEYLYRYFDFNQTVLQSQNQGTSIKGITRDTLSTIPIPLPPTKAELTAIAAALSDADALIQSLEKLIAKKRNIKQGAMQELFKPKEGWVIKPLKEVSFMKGRIGWQGLKQTEFTMNPDEPFLITGMNFKDGSIRWDEVYHVSNERYQIAKEIQLKENDVLITKDGTIGKLLYVDSIPYPGKASLNSHLLVFRPIQNSYIPKFLYCQLSSKAFKEYVELSKSGTTFFGLSQEAIGNYLAFLPPLTEQTRIATILTDMDTEIAALETKLAKYKRIKQGMMQNLFTGKIRLIGTSQRRQKVVAVDQSRPQKNHNRQINEAVIIAVLTKEFGSDKFPLGRKRYTKLSYLLHKHIEREAEGYVKKAAGPYNPATKYGGSERIAIENKYIKISASGQYSGFVSAENIAQAEEYFNKWYGQDALKWLSRFKYEKNDTLELWATVDMAVHDLMSEGKSVSVETIKELINNTEEWKPKLERHIFSDENIARAISKVEELFYS